MTKNKDFKNLVRSRMTATGETYTASRSALIRRSREPQRNPDEAAAIDPSAAQFRSKTLRTFMPEGTITAIPTKRRALVVVLLEILAAFSTERIYTEKEVNAILGHYHPDFARLRRELIDYRYLQRDSHIGSYWVNTAPPVHRGNQAQETTAFEAFLR